MAVDLRLNLTRNDLADAGTKRLRPGAHATWCNRHWGDWLLQTREDHRSAPRPSKWAGP
jgi:hypothetical protein